MKYIELTKDKFAIVDDEDFERINQYNWYYSTQGYARRSVYPNGRDKPKTLHMHRIIVNATDDDLIVDHINRNKLDNRKQNLRFVTKEVNCRNRKKSKGRHSSEYVGVQLNVDAFNLNQDAKNWRVSVGINGKSVWLGSFHTELEAAKARDKYIIDNKLEGYPLNFEQQETV